MRPTRPTIAVIGGGAAGAIAALACAGDEHLRRTHRVVLVDPAAGAGRGAAYSTTDPQHLLNVPASAMSAVAGDDDHFVRWLRRRHPAATAQEFRARREYGDYLAETLGQACRDGVVSTVQSLATDIRVHAEGVTVEHGLGLVQADAAILALGHSPPLPLDIRLHVGDPRRHVPDPWSAGGISRLVEATEPDDPVVLVGSGLTAVDVALTLAAERRRVCLVSRNGWLPRGHRLPRSAPVPLRLPAGAEPSTAPELEQLVVDHVTHAVAGGHDWRAAIDGLRPVTAALWQALPVGERRKLLAGPLRRWEVHRHRMAPLVDRRIRALRTTGRLTLTRGVVRAADLTPAAGHVQVCTGGEMRALPAVALVNCTGPTCDLRRYPGPLGHRLLMSGLARPDPTGVGIETVGAGAVVDASGLADVRLTALGALRRGALLETTAVPELRQQAAAIASVLRGVLAAPAGVDPYGDSAQRRVSSGEDVGNRGAFEGVVQAGP